MKKFSKRPLAMLFTFVFTLSLATVAQAGQVKGDAFSVTLPDGFGSAQQQKQTVDSPSGPINVVTYIAKADDGSAVILGYSEFSGKITDPAATLSSGRDSLLQSLGATAKNERDVEVSGHPARTFNYSATQPRTVFGRTDLVVVGPRMYQLIYLGFTQEALQKADVQGMFTSFKVQEIETEQAPAATNTDSSGGGTQASAN
jgi:hypothetical protein